ncbi:MAG TPA: hypothetical protein VJT31_11550 [Rugosimonospora sp.]|nr:hypothetical protein [Rugosimonospora sp.]
MAVRLDNDAVRAAADAGTYRAAEELLATGRLGQVTEAGGGVTGRVEDDRGAAYRIWVGVVSGALAAECDCPAGADAEDLCVHAVALTLAAIRDGFRWASAANPPSQPAGDPRVRQLVEIAAALPPRRLAALVGEHAAADRVLEARLLTAAGRLEPLTAEEAGTLRGTIDSVAADATRGAFDLHDVATAGQWLVDEMRVLAQRPPSTAALSIVEHAARVWDGLAVHLDDAWETYETEPEEIGDALRAVHVVMCGQLRPGPDELAGRR